MTAQELNTYINRVLGNSIRCLLPSYWWKRLLTQIVEYVDEVDTKFDNKVKTLNSKINNIDLDDYTTKSEFNSLNSKVNSLDGNVSNLEIEKQDVLISGTSIKTINGVSILGSGDIEILSESGGITSETDPIFTASAAANITTTDITNWNSKTSNSGTITEIKMNGSSRGTSGVVDLGTVLTSHLDISGKLDKTEASSTYLTKTDASNTYLGKTAKAVSAGTADSATKATQDGSGNVITTTYATKTELESKVSKDGNKQLSEEDFTSALKQKLEDLNNYDDTEISEAINQLREDFDDLVDGDSSTAIKTFNEIIAFLEGIEDSEDLSSIISAIEQQIAAKQDKINDLEDIRTNAAKGKTSVQKVKINGTEKTPNISGVVDLGTVITSHQDISGKLDKTEASNTYVTKQELILNIDPYNTDGIYAVTQDGDLVSYDRADESCMGVALVKGDHKFMIAKNDALQGSTFLWMYPISDTELTNYATVDGVNTSGAFFDQSKTQLSTDYKTWTAGALSDFNGKENSTIIASVSSRTNEMGSALKAFNNGSTTDNNYGLDDWYIPALGQLALIRIHLDEINEFFVKIGGSVFGPSYWSSSEESLGLAWQISFNSSSTVGSPNKDMHNKCVRFIRDITIKEPLSKTSLLINDSNYIVDYSMFPDGVYAVTNNLSLVSRENADESCIGVAFIQGDHRYMISKYNSEQQASWGYNLRTDIPDIINCPTTTEAESDFNGKENTEAILRAYITYNQNMLETDMCYILNTFNIKSESLPFDDWYIPAYGQLHIMLPFKLELNALFKKINGDNINSIYQTSSELSSVSGCTYDKFNGLF